MSERMRENFSMKLAGEAQAQNLREGVANARAPNKWQRRIITVPKETSAKRLQQIKTVKTAMQHKMMPIPHINSLSRPTPSFPFPPLSFLFSLLIFSLFSFRFISSPFPFLFIVMLLLLLFFLILFLFSPPAPPPPPYPPGPPPGPLPPLLSPLLLLGVHSVVVAASGAEKVPFLGWLYKRTLQNRQELDMDL